MIKDRIRKPFFWDLRKMFSLLVVLYPIFSRYASPVSFLSLSEFLLMLFFAIALLDSLIQNTKMKIVKGIIPLVIYLIFQLIYALLRFNGDLVIDAAGTVARLLFLYSAIMILSKTYFDWDSGVKFLEGSAAVVAIYGLVQTIFASIHVYLTTYIPFLPVADNYEIDQQIVKSVSEGVAYRCRSLLREPAAVSVYLILALIVVLFIYPNRPNKYKKAFLYSFCCLVCVSSTGIIMCAFVWLLYFNDKYVMSRIQKRKFAVIAIAVIIFGVAYSYYSGILNLFITRTFGWGDTGASLKGLLNQPRFFSIFDAVGSLNNALDFLFGAGMVAYGSYLPGYIRTLYDLGIIGFLIFGCFFYWSYIRGNRVQKKIMIIFILLNIGTEVMLGQFSFLYLPFVFASMRCRMCHYKGETKQIYINL